MQESTVTLKRRILKKNLKKESKLVAENSMNILREFEQIGKLTPVQISKIRENRNLKLNSAIICQKKGLINIINNHIVFGSGNTPQNR